MGARDEAAGEIPLLEWISAGAGLALVLGTVLALMFWGLTGASGPPSISVRLLSVQPLEQGYVALIRARNTGGTTAADVRIEGTLESDSGEVETSEMSFDYLPAGSQREGGLFFRNHPTDLRLRLKAEGYRKP